MRRLQWDWFERRRAPWGGTAYVLLGILLYSSRIRGMIAESLDQPHLIEAMHGVMVRLGGTPRVWRTDHSGARFQGSHLCAVSGSGAPTPARNPGQYRAAGIGVRRPTRKCAARPRSQPDNVQSSGLALTRPLTLGQCVEKSRQNGLRGQARGIQNDAGGTPPKVFAFEHVLPGRLVLPLTSGTT